MPERKPFERCYDFKNTVPENVLKSYLSRAVTHVGLVMEGGSGRPTPTFRQDLDMLLDMGAKYIGRACCDWVTPPNFEQQLKELERRAAVIHREDPQMMLQACLFENIDPGVSGIKIPEYVFRAFGEKPEDRCFRFEDIGYADGQCYEMYGPYTTPPDISRLESRMYYYYRGTRYIDCGIEAIHFGQYYLMNRNDPDMTYYAQLMDMLREYAKTHARRGYVLMDAHVPYLGVRSRGRLLYDFNAFPARLKEVEGEPFRCVLEKDYLEGVYQKCAAGVVPAGYETDAQPYLIEIDNYGNGPRKQGDCTVDTFYVWNEDEITWLGRQDRKAQEEALRYFHDWITENTPHCFFQFPTRRGYTPRLVVKNPVALDPKAFAALYPEAVPLRQTADGLETLTLMFSAHMPTPETPNGLGLAKVMKEIWEAE